MRSRIIAMLAAGLCGASALADTHTFPSVTVNADDTIQSVALTGAPANTYRSVTITTTWTAGLGDPYSEEAIYFLTDTAAAAGNLPGGTVYHAFGRNFPNGGPNGTTVTLTTTIFLDRAYDGGQPLHLAFLQDFPGSEATWADVSVTLNTDGPPAVAPPIVNEDLGTQCGTDTVSRTAVTLGTTEVKWYKFTITPHLTLAGAEYLDIDTSSATTALNTDTVLALYSADGDLIAFDDDDGPGFSSLLTFGAQSPTRDPGVNYTPGTGAALRPADGRDGPLSPGEYYLAVMRYSGTFNVERDFVATTNAIGATFSTQLNVRKSIVCGPTACNAADVATAGNPDPDAGPDGFLTGDDFDLFINAFFNEIRRTSDNTLIADLVDGDGNPPPDGFLTGSDFDYFLSKFFEGC